MSIQELLNALRPYSWVLLVWFLLVPVLTWLYGRLHSREHGHYKPHRYIYSGLLAISGLPGLIAFMLCIYTLLILRGNMLEVNIFVYFLPIISMVATLLVARRNVELKKIPGFGRIMGAIIILSAVFFALFLLLNTRLFLFIGGGFGVLLIIILLIVAAVWYGWKKFNPKK